MLKIPSKYGRTGLKRKCLKCKYQVSQKCGLTGKGISSCEYKDRHRYNLIACVPGVPGARRTRILNSTSLEEALVEMAKFKEELQQSGFHKLKFKKEKHDTTLSHYITEYLDAISGVNTLAILVRHRSKAHIDDSTRVFKCFKAALKKAGYHFERLLPGDVDDIAVNAFHEYLLNDLKYSLKTYSKYIGVMKTLFNWLIRVKNQKIHNPFNHVVIHNVKKEVAIITKEEFEKLLAATTSENGYNHKTKKNQYREWLKPAFRLGLETGLRREELISLRWSDIVPIDGTKLVCRIPNLKVNKIMGLHNSADERMKYIPITKSLLALLNELGYAEKKNTDALIIDTGLITTVYGGMDFLSRAFSHFIKFATKRDLEFKCLRKTYMTKLTMAAGPNAKLFTGSSSDAVLKNHYLSTAFMAANLEDFIVL